MQLCLEFWYVKFFLSTTNDYIFLDCVYRTTTRMTTANGHHLQDNEWGLKTHHLSLKSLVCFFLVYFFRYIFSFFFFYCSFNLPQHVHHHHYHPKQWELTYQAQVRFFLPLFYFSNYYFNCKVPPHHLRIQR